jgi:hypothetical protein
MTQYISDSTKARWLEQMASDYPNTPKDMLLTILDLYQSDKEWVEEKIKHIKKSCKGPVQIKNKLTLEEMERLQEIGVKNQEAIAQSFEGGVIPGPQEEEPKNTCVIQEDQENIISSV